MASAAWDAAGNRRSSSAPTGAMSCPSGLAPTPDNSVMRLLIHRQKSLWDRGGQPLARRHQRRLRTIIERGARRRWHDRCSGGDIKDPAKTKADLRAAPTGGCPGPHPDEHGRPAPAYGPTLKRTGKRRRCWRESEGPQCRRHLLRLLHQGSWQDSASSLVSKTWMPTSTARRWRVLWSLRRSPSRSAAVKRMVEH